MKRFAAAAGFLVVVASLIESKEWPVHTVCDTDPLKVSYRSCDASVQDVGFSIYPCNNKEEHNITLALLLRHNINALFINVKVYLNTINIFSLTQTFCELDYERFTLCGGRKGVTAPALSRTDTFAVA